MPKTIAIALCSVFVLALAAPLLSTPAQACMTNNCVDSPPPSKPKGD